MSVYNTKTLNKNCFHKQYNLLNRDKLNPAYLQIKAR